MTDVSSDYTGSQTKLPKILLNGNNICMARLLKSLVHVWLLIKVSADSRRRRASCCSSMIRNNIGVIAILFPCGEHYALDEWLIAGEHH